MGVIISILGYNLVIITPILSSSLLVGRLELGTTHLSYFSYLFQNWSEEPLTVRSSHKWDNINQIVSPFADC